MDNFRNYKTGRRKPTAVDGFVRHRNHTAPHQPGLAEDEAAGGPKAPDAVRPQIGDFKRVDGFHSVNRGTVGFASNPSIVIEQGKRPGKATTVELPEKQKHKTKHKKRNWRKIIKRGSLALLILVLLGGGYLGIKAYIKSRQILAGGGGAAALQENVDPTLLNGEGDGRVNILLMGTGGEDHDNGSYLVDTIIVASIDPIHKEAALLSIPRDFYVRTDDYGSMRINAVFKTARNASLKKNSKDTNAATEFGMDAMDDIVEKTMGIPIHYHAIIDFTGFEKAIDTVGGIDVNVTEDTSVYEVMHINGRSYTLNVKPGQQHFDGFRALAFARSRKTSSRGDFARSERQRLMLVALKDKITSAGTLANPVKINQLLSDFGDHVRTNFSVDELIRVYEIGNGISSDKVESISLVDPPNVLLASANIGGSVQIPRAGQNNYKEIHNFVRNKLLDGYLRQENASIAIYNGTSVAGLAARTADDLKSYGYNITTVADAPTKGNQETILVDLRNGEKKYTKHYLEQRLSTTARTSMPDGIAINPGTADFVIILGTNEQTRLED